MGSSQRQLPTGAALASAGTRGGATGSSWAASAMGRWVVVCVRGMERPGRCECAVKQ
jgi:hypothetical protein